MTNARALTDRIFFESTGLSADNTIRLTERALHGADGGELFMEHTTGKALVWYDGKLRTSEPSLREGYSMRYIRGEMPGFAFDNDFSEKGLKGVARSAREARKYAEGTGCILLPDPQRQGALYTLSNPAEGMSETDRIKMLETFDHKIRSMDSSVTQVSLSLITAWSAVTVIRHDGKRVDDIRPMVRLGISVTGEKSGKKAQGSAGYAIRGTLSDFFNDVGMDKLAAQAVTQMQTDMQAIPCPAGKMDVIMSAGASGLLLHEAIGHGLEGDFNRKGNSAFTGLVGQQIAARGVTVIDQGNIPNQRGALNFDDEGLETGAATLIEDGILKGYIQDTINARLMGVAPTGNGRRESYYKLPMPRMTTTFMQAGQYPKEELFAAVKGRALYAVQFAGGQVDTASGKFVFAVNEGYLVEDGKIVAPVKGATLIGDCINAMKAIKMIGNDLVIDTAGWTCGKEGQSVPVGVGQPHLLMGGMNVGGTAQP